MKAADIKDEEVLRLVESGLTAREDVATELMSVHPRKVVLAKIAQMVNKGRLLSPCVFTGALQIPPKKEKEVTS